MVNTYGPDMKQCSAKYMTSLVQVIAWRRVDVKPLPKPVMTTTCNTTSDQNNGIMTALGFQSQSYMTTMSVVLFRPGRSSRKTLQWRHIERDGVLNHRCIDCLLNRLFRRRSKKTSKLRVTGLYEGNPPPHSSAAKVTYVFYLSFLNFTALYVIFDYRSAARDSWIGFDGVCAFIIVMGIFVLLWVQELVIVFLKKCFCVSSLFCHQIRSWFHIWTDSLAVGNVIVCGLI